MALDKAGRGEIENQAPIHLLVKVEIKIVERFLGIAELCLFSPSFQQYNTKVLSVRFGDCSPKPYPSVCLDLAAQWAFDDSFDPFIAKPRAILSRKGGARDDPYRKQKAARPEGRAAGRPRARRRGRSSASGAEPLREKAFGPCLHYLRRRATSKHFVPKKIKSDASPTEVR